MYAFPFEFEWPEPPLPEMAPPPPPPPPPEMAPAGDPLGNQPLNELLGPPPEQAPQPELTPAAFGGGPGGQGGPQGPYDPRKLRGMTPETQKLFHYLNDKYGDDVRLTSGYRSPDYNRKVGGAKNSQHMYGRAFDLNANRRWRTDDLARFTTDAYNKARELGVPLSGGYYGLNPRNGHALHFDTRPGGGVTWGANRRGNTTPGWLAGAIRGQGPQPDPRLQAVAHSQGGSLGPGGPSGIIDPQGSAAPPAPVKRAGVGPQMSHNPQNVPPPNDPGSPLHRNPLPPVPAKPPGPGGVVNPGGPVGAAGGGGGMDSRYAAAYQYDLWLAEQERQKQLQAAFGKLGENIASASNYRPQNVTTSGMRTAANAKGLDADRFDAMNKLGGRTAPPSEILAALQRRALFS